jgi:hypothetical protein
VIVLRPISVFTYFTWSISSYTGIVETIVEVTEAGTVVVGCNTSLQRLGIPGIPVNPRKHGFSEQGSAARTLAAEERSRRVGNDFIFNKLREDRVNCGKYEYQVEDDDQHPSTHNLYVYGRSSKHRRAMGHPTQNSAAEEAVA